MRKKILEKASGVGGSRGQQWRCRGAGHGAGRRLGGRACVQYECRMRGQCSVDDRWSERSALHPPWAETLGGSGLGASIGPSLSELLRQGSLGARQGAWLTWNGGLASVPEEEADGRSQQLEEEELRGCLGQQRVSKVRTVGRACVSLSCPPVLPGPLTPLLPVLG